MRAIIYVRQSKDREEGIADQIAKCRALIQARGWTEVHAPFTDNDVSASNGKRRPDYERAMTMVRNRQTDVVVVSVMDRLYRKVTELEGIIPVMEDAGVSVATVSGEYDLSTDSGRLVARILASVAQGEMETKARRQRDAAAVAAKAGRRWRGSQRPFGWSADDFTVPVESEAEAIREACRLILAGGTISGVVRTWTAMGVKPAQGERWTRQSVRAILTNPALYGARRYRGEVVGRGGWQGIVSEETFTAVNSVLADPSRKPPRGVKSLLGGLARCRCGNRVIHSHAQQGHGVYRCEHVNRGEGPHVSIKSELADAYVTEVIVDRMSWRDAVTIFASDNPAVDVQALRDESAAIRRNLDTLAADMAVGLISRSAMLAATERANTRLAEIDQTVTEGSREHVASELLTAEDVRGTWKRLDISRQRAIIKSLITVTLNPVGRGCRLPDPERSFDIAWAA